MKVDPQGLRGHATKVAAALEGVPMSQQAAGYLARADDGYGLLVRPYAESVLNSLHDRITENLQKLHESTEGMPGKLRKVADTFESLDNSRADGTNRKRADLELAV